jgi:branched-chain amino acid transport system permease protein
VGLLPHVPARSRSCNRLSLRADELGVQRIRQGAASQVALGARCRWSDDWPRRPARFAGIDYFYAHEVSPLAQAIIFLAVAILCTIAIAIFEKRGPGRRVIAVANDPGLAASLAIDPIRTRLQVFAIAGAIAGLGGGLFAHHATYIDATNFSLMLGVHAVAYTLIGGLASVLGPVAGTLFDIGFLEGLRVVGGYRMVAFGSVIVLVLILRPRGLIAPRRGVS